MIYIGKAAAATALLALGAQAAAQAPATQRQQAASNEQMNLFKKGFAACLEPKGYTVK